VVGFLATTITTGASIVFRIPLYRDVLLWLGVVDAGRKTARAVLGSGRSLYVLPGGELEQIQTVEGKNQVYASRKGFVRLAVEYGVDVVPVYAFGEVNLYSTSNFLFHFRKWVCKQFYVALPIAYRTIGGVPLVFPVCSPKRTPVTVCFGVPVSVTKMAPSNSKFEEEVDKGHDEFLKHLQNLFDHFKAECGCKDTHLEFLS